LCSQSGGTSLSPDRTNIQSALDNSEEVSFSIKRSGDASVIPANYFCKWSIELKTSIEYQLSIRRNYFPVKEQIELNIIGEEKQ